MSVRYGMAVSAVFLSLAAGNLAAQSSQDCSSLPSADAGTLVTIWVVTKPVPENPKVDIATYREQTAGTFGTPSSNTGTTAGRYGQTAGSLGQNAGSTGQTAGTYGQTAGSVGATAGSAGVNAGDTGQMAGTFGDSLSTIATAANRTTPPGTPTGNGGRPNTVASKADPDPLRLELTKELQVPSIYPYFHVSFVEVPSNKLRTRLEEASGLSANRDAFEAVYPDLLMASSLPVDVPPANSWFSPVWLGGGMYPQQVYDPLNDYAKPFERKFPGIYLMTQAPHKDAAKVLLVSWSEKQRYVKCRAPSLDEESRPPVELALRTVMGEVTGKSDDKALDAEFGHLAPMMIEDKLPWALAGSMKPHVDVLEATANERFAVVTLRVLVNEGNLFAIQHPLVILRKDEHDAWKVLQLTSDLDPSQQRAVMAVLGPYGDDIDEEKLGSPKGISQASPPDNDNREPMPELWWDNLGGATLQVVEWQTGYQTYHRESHLFFVNDNHHREMTRVRAAFAQDAGRYVWRVWSVGDGGVIKLSPWRSFNVIR